MDLINILINIDISPESHGSNTHDGFLFRRHPDTISHMKTKYWREAANENKQRSNKSKHKADGVICVKSNVKDLTRRRNECYTHAKEPPVVQCLLKVINAGSSCGAESIRQIWVCNPSITWRLWPPHRGTCCQPLLTSRQTPPHLSCSSQLVKHDAK